MEKEPQNDGTLPHTPGTDDERAIGSPVNTGGRHGASHKINTGNAGTNSQNGELIQPVNSSPGIDADHGDNNAPAADERFFDGNNDRDANRTPYAGSNKQ